MGAQIAAHLAAAGVRTYLLDLASTEPPADPKVAKLIGKGFRSTRALMAIDGLKKLKPSPLMSPNVLPNIIPGNFDDDMATLADCDWVIEAVAEKIDIKQSIHKRIAEVVRPGTPVTTNTSGILLKTMLHGFSPAYQAAMFGTHFFNPPRYMRLVEIIPHDGVNADLVAGVAQFIEERLGKGIVYAKDTINFIGNRIGVFNIQITLKHMQDLGLNIETVDALTGKLMGRPASATFRTMDVVGLDTFAHVAKNVADLCAKDPYREAFIMPPWVDALIKSGALGQKTNSLGFYKKDKDAKGKTAILAFRPETKTYVEQAPEEFPWMAEAGKISNATKRLSFILQQKDKGADFIWRVLRDTLSYAALLVDEIAGALPKPLDDAMKWGFNWDFGPFELWQGLGVDAIFDRMTADKTKLPSWAKKGMTFYNAAPDSPAWQENSGPSSQTHVTDGKTRSIERLPYQFALPKRGGSDDKRIVEKNGSASLVDLGDGVACLTFHTKMNALDDDAIAMMQKSVARVHRDFAGLVVGNEGSNFSAGANLNTFAGQIDKKDWTGIDRMLREFQGSMQLMKFAPFPSVSAPHGLVLGGGCEVALQTSWRVAAGETYAGLVEVGVGLLPGGGGTKELALRCYNLMSLADKWDPQPFLQRAFMLIGMGRTSGSAQEAVEMGLFPSGTTSITLSKDYQILRAKEQVLHMVQQGYVPPTPQTKVKVWGDPGIQTFKLALYNMVEGRQISPYDAFIAERIATVLCGGEVDQGTEVSEQYFLELERRTFVELCQQPKTLDRIHFMLKNGKPLRN